MVLLKQLSYTSYIKTEAPTLPISSVGGGCGGRAYRAAYKAVRRPTAPPGLEFDISGVPLYQILAFADGEPNGRCCIPNLRNQRRKPKKAPKARQLT